MSVQNLKQMTMIYLPNCVRSNLYTTLAFLVCEPYFPTLLQLEKRLRMLFATNGTRPKSLKDSHHATHIRCFEFKIARLLCIMYVYFKLPLEFMVSFSIYILFTFSFEAVNRISLFICLLTGVQFAGLGVLRKRTGCTLITMSSWIYSTGWEYGTPGTSIQKTCFPHGQVVKLDIPFSISTRFKTADRLLLRGML